MLVGGLAWINVSLSPSLITFTKLEEASSIFLLLTWGASGFPLAGGGFPLLLLLGVLLAPPHAGFPLWVGGGGAG